MKQQLLKPKPEAIALKILKDGSLTAQFFEAECKVFQAIGNLTNKVGSNHITDAFADPTILGGEHVSYFP